jgi:sorbitol/mannitol transport system permease protein
MLSSGTFYHVLLNTFLITIISLVVCTILGLALAFLFNREFKGISILRALIVLPYFVPGAVIGIIWKTLMLDPSLGFNYYIMHFLGVRPIDFFGRFALGTIVILICWQWTPFFYLILRAGLQNLPQSVVESAQIDGARGWRMLVKIKIPSILGHFKIALMLGAINVWKVFDLIFVTTQGGPGTTSSNLPYYAYRSAFSDWQIGQSATASVLSVIIILLVITRFSGVISKSLK